MVSVRQMRGQAVQALELHQTCNKASVLLLITDVLPDIASEQSGAEAE